MMRVAIGVLGFLLLSVQSGLALEFSPGVWTLDGDLYCGTRVFMLEVKATNADGQPDEGYLELQPATPLVGALLKKWAVDPEISGRNGLARRVRVKGRIGDFGVMVVTRVENPAEPDVDAEGELLVDTFLSAIDMTDLSLFAACGFMNRKGLLKPTLKAVRAAKSEQAAFKAFVDALKSVEHPKKAELLAAVEKNPSARAAIAAVRKLDL